MVVNRFLSDVIDKFKDAVSGGAVNITSLYIGTRYPVLHCDRIGTKYGDAVHLTLREDAEDNVIRVFLPRHYGMTITDEDMADIIADRLNTTLRTKGSVRPPTALCYR